MNFDFLKYYKWWTFKNIRSPRDLLIFALNPLRLENEARERNKIFPFWKKISSSDFMKYKNSYALFVKNQKKPLILIKEIRPYTTSYLEKIGDIFLIRYYNKKKKMFMEISEHGNLFGAGYSGNIQEIPLPEEAYMKNYKKQIEIIKSCIKDLQKYSPIFWRYSLIKKYIEKLEELKSKIKSKIQKSK